MLKTKVKVGSVTNLSEARYCAGMGVDFLSFPIPSVDPKTYQEITGWVAGPKFGIEITTKEFLDQYSADFILTSGNLIEHVPEAAKLIVSLEINQWESERVKLAASKSKILFLEFAVFSIDATTESILKQASKQFEILIKLRDPASLDQVLKLPIAGVSLEGSAELRTGLKEYPLAEVLEKLDVD
jgi:phosphoribosylanthranilate isomerase